MYSSRRSFLKASATAAGWLPLLGSSAMLSQACAQDPAVRFLAAAGAGDLDQVKGLLSANSSLLAAKDSAGRTAFALAHLAGHRPVGDYLGTAGYEPDVHEAALAQAWDRFDIVGAQSPSAVNTAHPIGGTAMYAAAAGGAGADMWRVYSLEGDPNLVPPGATGASPLQIALTYSDLATAEMTASAILSNAATANPQSRVSDPPLHLAAARGSNAMVEMLIRKGADVSALDREGRTAEEVATRAGHADTSGMLARHAEVPRTHSTSRTAYDVNGAAYVLPDITQVAQATRSRVVGESHRNLEFVTGAIGKDPRLAHSVATNDEICVEACAHTGNKPIVELLLAHGSPYSLPTAVMRGDFPRVKSLLDEDPLRIHERGAHDFALLWYPIIGRCDPSMLELLLARGAKVEEQHFLGTTALHWASMGGQVEMVDLLIQHGADVNRAGRKFGPVPETPLQSALRRKQEDVARLLRQHGATA